MRTYNYQERFMSALTRRDRRAAANSVDKGSGGAVVVGGTGTSSSGGSTGGTGSGSGAIIDTTTIQAGDGIRVEKNGSIYKILHGLTSDGESSANEDNDGYFIKNIEVDAFGHIKKITVKGMTDSFDDRYLRKDQPDETDYNITFKDGLTIGDFVEGLLGAGAHIDKDGNGWLGGLHLRDFLEVPELRFNRVDVVSGEIWNSVAFGTIESVDTATMTATLKLEDGELSGLHVNDICRGIFHNLTGNESANGVDSAGFDKLAGFSTSYFTPTQIIDNSHFKYSLKPGTTTHPCRAMKFAVYGNFTDTTRQACAYQTRNYLRFLRGVNTWAISQTHVSAQFGDLTGLQVDGQFLTQGSVYLNDVYFGGNILKVGGLKDQLKGSDAYTVGLDKYTYLYKMVTGSLPSNIYFSVFAAKGATALTYASTPSTGKFSVNVKSKVGCTVTQSNNKITFATFTGEKEGSVVVTVNCEGIQSFDLTFTATKVLDGVQGATGAAGATGNTIQQVYRRSDTQPATPAASTTPSGWAFTPPTGTAPLWMSKATFTGTGALSGTWSYPIKITGDKGADGAPGSNGLNGSSGPAICFRGEYNSSKYYYGTATRVDVVKVSTVYYMATSTAGTIYNKYPPSNYGTLGTKQWVQMSSFEHVATGLLFAESAIIAGWKFTNNYIISQNDNFGLDGNADDTKPRLWCGATYEKRDSAPIRFYKNKVVFGDEQTADASIGRLAFKTELGQFTIGDSGLYATSSSTYGGVYGNPRGLWLRASGSVRVVSNDGNKFGLLSSLQNSVLDIRQTETNDFGTNAASQYYRDFSALIDKGKIPISIWVKGNTKEDYVFVSRFDSSGYTGREFSVSFGNVGDDPWYRRVLIRATILPMRSQLDVTTPPTRAAYNSDNSRHFFNVLWDQYTGCFCLE